MTKDYVMQTQERKKLNVLILIRKHDKQLQLIAHIRLVLQLLINIFIGQIGFRK